MLAMGPRDLNSAPYSPVHCNSHSMTSFQSSELTELPVVENSQLFAQRVHSAQRYAPMGQVCFTAISSNCACPTVFIALSSVFQIIVLCACCPSVQWPGLRAKVPSSLRHCTRSAVACWAVGWQTCSQAHARGVGLWGDPPPSGDPELLEAKKFFGLK